MSNFPQEYEALGVDFKTRGRKIEEQIAVMRALWTQEQVDFEGRFHKIHTAIGPRPGRSIPIWMGGGTQEDQMPSDRVRRRVGLVPGGSVFRLAVLRRKVGGHGPWDEA